MSRILVVHVVILVSLFLLPQFLPAQIVDLCGSTAVSNGGCLLACPEGDGDHLSDISATIYLTVLYMGDPVPNIPAADFWLVACDPADELVLCGGSASVNADGPTDADGKTTINGPIAAGGCAEGLAVVVQGIILLDPANDCTSLICLPIKTRSPDLDSNLIVELPDLALFAQAFHPAPYQACADLNCDGLVAIQDLALFAQHFKSPRHDC